jgi:hypothetical protein
MKCKIGLIKDIFRGIGILTVPSIYIFEVLIHVRNNGEWYSQKKLGTATTIETKTSLSIPNTTQPLWKTFLLHGYKLYNKLTDSLKCPSIKINRFKDKVRSLSIGIFLNDNSIEVVMSGLS